jgi:hypothetical protein
MGTAAEVWSTMTRSWSVEPTSERIIDDIQKFEDILDKLIDARGCVVQDVFFRTGRRALDPLWVRLDGKDGECKLKPRPSQRKDTLRGRVIHFDATEAYNTLCGQGNAEQEAARDELMVDILLDMARIGMQQEEVANGARMEAEVENEEDQEEDVRHVDDEEQDIEFDEE